MTLNCDIYASRRRLRAWHGGGGGPPAEGRSAGREGFFLRLSPPTSPEPGPKEAVERCAAGQGVCAAGQGVCLRAGAPPGSGPEEAAEGPVSWTWSLLSTPLAADFGPGPEARLRGGESAFHRLSKLPTASGLARRRQFPVLETTQTSQVLSRWTETTWPASLGWPGPSGPAAQLVLNWRTALACFARRARGPSRCHADRLPSLLLSAGLMALQTSQPDLVCSAAPLASLSANCPLQKSRPCKNPDFRTLQKFHTLQNLAKIQIFALTKPCKNQFVKPCETLQNCLYVKRQIAKPCETLRNTAKPYLRPYLRKCAKAAVKLAKACEIIFAKTCQ